MKQRTLTFVLVIMTAALFGTLWMQLYWIRTLTRTTQEYFDKQITDLLDHVSYKLEKDEQAAVIAEAEQDWYASDIDQTDNAKKFDFIEMKRVQRELTYQPVADRINLEHLDRYLRDEIKGLGLDETYHYGVYSNKLRAFVIHNNSFLVLDATRPQTDQVIFQNLYNSKYSIQLFRNDLEADGYLMLYFPEFSHVSWNKIWPKLLPTILLLLIVAGAFGYTLFVIVRQKKLSEMKNDFINNMTHEFKTPIATIALASDFIENPMVLEDKPKLLRYIDIIKQENRRMLNQVEKVLQMAQVERREIKFEWQSVNMHDIIENAADNVAFVVSSRQGSLDLRLQATDAVVLGDKTHLTNVIHNLLDNANKYSPESPRIIITTTNNAKVLSIAVQDHGMGISKENQRFIFEKFYRVHTGNLHDVKGFGLGLSYVKSIVDQHKGKIEVKSELGKGSTFIIELPLVQA